MKKEVVMVGVKFVFWCCVYEACIAGCSEDL